MPFPQKGGSKGTLPRLVVRASLFFLLAFPSTPQEVRITEFPLPTPNSAPKAIARGSDGAVWFSETNAGKIGRIDLAGAITEYPLPAGSIPARIVVGQDGNLYFINQQSSGSSFIGKITPSGIITQFPVPQANARLDGITAGPDGNIWFTEPDLNSVVSVSTSGVFSQPIVLGGFLSLLGHGPTGITTGPDNNLWLTATADNSIGVLHLPSLSYTGYPLNDTDSTPTLIIAGPDGKLYFGSYEEIGLDGLAFVGAITTGGAVTHTERKNGVCIADMTAGSDGEIWYTDPCNSSIWVLETGGGARVPSNPWGITVGWDRALWFTEPDTNKIGRLWPDDYEFFEPLSDGVFTQVSVGADGSVWVLNSSQQIFTYDSSANAWRYIPGALAQIAVGSSTAVWGLNAQGQIYRWDSVGNGWVNVPGALAQIAVGADGDVWGINVQSNIYHYNPQQQSWNQVPGWLSSITVGSAGAVYGFNTTGSIYWYNPGTGYFQYVPGTVGFSEISVGVDGDLWAVKNNTAYHYDPLHAIPDATEHLAHVVAGSGGSVFGVDQYRTYQWDAVSGEWDLSSGGFGGSIAVGANGAVWGLDPSPNYLYGAPSRPYQTLAPAWGRISQLSAGVDGSAWGVNTAGVVYHFNSGVQTFAPITGAPALAQVSVGAGADVWGVSSSGQIFEYDAFTGTWNNIPGELNQIQVSEGPLPYGSVWGLNATGQIYTYDFSTTSWTNIPGALAQLSVGVDGTVWGINAQQQIYRFNTATRSWTNIPGALAQISVGSATNIWGVNAEQQVYRYDTSAKTWINIPGAYLTQVRVSFDGAVWGVNAGGNLYRWDSAAQSFNLVGSGVSNVVVANTASVWAFNASSGAAYTWF